MSGNHFPILLNLGLALVGSLVSLAVAVWLVKKGNQVSLAKRIIRFVLAGILALPALPVAILTGWFMIENFPFTSGIVAHDLGRNGDEICIVQTFNGAEPYQVSLYARRAGQPWIWNYLGHEEGRWRNGHTEFEGDFLRVYTGSTLRKTFSFTAATKVPELPEYQLPAEFTPQQILAWHNRKYGER